MKKQSCSRCKQQIIGIPHKLQGSILCDNCYPFDRDETGKLKFKNGKEGSLTFGKYGFHNPIVKG